MSSLTLASLFQRHGLDDGFKFRQHLRLSLFAGRTSLALYETLSVHEPGRESLPIPLNDMGYATPVIPGIMMSISINI